MAVAGLCCAGPLAGGARDMLTRERRPNNHVGRGPSGTAARALSHGSASFSGGSAGHQGQALHTGLQPSGNRGHLQRRGGTVLAAHGRGSYGSLSSYAMPVHRSASRALPSWFEFCLRDMVTNLGGAPFVQAVYEGRGGRRTQFARRAFTEEMTRDVAAFSELTQTEGLGVADTLMFVHRVSAGVTCLNRSAGLPACGREQMRLPAAGCGMFDEILLKEGLVGDCDGEEELGAEPCGSGGGDGSSVSETSYWGLVMQSRGDGPAGCFLLKTTQKVGGDCKCTHYSLTRVCEGVPLEQQLVQAWSR